MGDELIVDPDGRLWHIAHVPFRWKDGTPAKLAWTPDQEAQLQAIFNRRLLHSLTNTADEAAKRQYIALFYGIVAPRLVVPNGRLNAHILEACVRGRFEISRISENSLVMGCLFHDQVSIIQAKFDGNATFESNRFLGRICCLTCEVAGDATFHESIFFGRNVFDELVVKGKLGFTRGDFRGPASFDNSTFHRAVEFYRSEFQDEVTFAGTTFESRSSFDIVSFRSRFSFENADFKDAVFFTSINWPELKPCHGGTSQYERAFYNTRFKGSAVFHGSGFGHHAAFDGAVFDGSVLIDSVGEREAKAQFDIELSAAKTSTDVPEDRLERLRGGAYALRHAMEKASDKKREFLLYRFELMVRQCQTKTPSWERKLSHLYQISSDYGTSIGRPLLLMLALTVFFTFIYSLIGGFSTGAFSLHRPLDLVAGDWTPVFRGISFSVGRTFPFGPWTIQSSDFQQALIGSGATLSSVLVRVLGTSQSIVAAVLVFLSALAVRRRFQIG